MTLYANMDFSSLDYAYSLNDNLGIIDFLEEYNETHNSNDISFIQSLTSSKTINKYLEKYIQIPNTDSNFNWKQIYFNQPNKLKEFVYSFNFIDNIKLLINIMKKDSILHRDSEIVNYLNYYFIRLLEENKVIGLNKVIDDNNSILNLNSIDDQDNIYIIIFNTGLLTSNNNYIYSFNINIKNNITNDIIPPPGFEDKNLKKWKCINFIDELQLDDYITSLNKIPMLSEIKKHISIANFLFSPSIILKQPEIIFNPEIKINNNIKSRKFIYDLWTKFKQFYLSNKDKHIPINIIKLDSNKLTDIIFDALDFSIKKYSRNKHMIVHQYYFDSYLSKGSIQLLIPICLDNNNSWTPHCAIGLKYINDSYEISTLLCLKFARLNSRLVSEFENGLWNNYIHEKKNILFNEEKQHFVKTLQQKKSDSTISSDNTIEEMIDDTEIKKNDEIYESNSKFLRPCKHHFGLSGCKINSCINGDNCNYSHDINRVKVCKMWQLSFCKKGDKCDFLHDDNSKKKH